MAATPQSNATLAQIAEALKAADNICICGHVSPDGDCLGSQLALRLALLQLGKKVAVLLASDSPVEAGMKFLPGFEALMFAGDFKGQCDTFVCVDVPTEARLGEAAVAVKAGAALTITIDHHATDKAMSNLSYTDAQSPSNTMLVWDVIKLMGVQLNFEIATCTLTGLITDTGRFAHSNTTEDAFRYAQEMCACGANPNKISEQVFQNRSVASLTLEAIAIDHLHLSCAGQVAISYISAEDMRQTGAIKADCEPLIDVLRSISGVRLCCMLRDEGQHIRGSFRAKDDTDMAALAAKFGGGGHRAAAGFTLYMPLEQALSTITETLEGALEE